MTDFDWQTSATGESLDPYTQLADELDAAKAQLSGSGAEKLAGAKTAQQINAQFDDRTKALDDFLREGVAETLDACLQEWVGNIFEANAASAAAAMALTNDYFGTAAGPGLARLCDALQKQAEALTENAGKEKAVIVWRAVRDATENRPGLESLHQAAIERLGVIDPPPPPPDKRLLRWLLILVGVAVVVVVALILLLGGRGPEISEVDPKSRVAGESGFDLIITGTGFKEGTKVYWGSVERSTTFSSTTALVAKIEPGDIADQGEIKIKVVNPGGGRRTESNLWPFQVTAKPTPTPVPTSTLPPPATQAPTSTPTYTPTPTPTATAMPIAGDLGCTLRLSGPVVTARFPLSQVTKTEEKTKVEVVWRDLVLSSPGGQDCKESKRADIASRPYRLTLVGDASSVVLQEDEGDARIDWPSTGSTFTLTKSFKVASLSEPSKSGKLTFELDYDAGDARWQPVMTYEQGEFNVRLKLVLGWGEIAVATATPTYTPTPIASPTPQRTATPAIPTVKLVAPADGVDGADVQSFQWEISGSKPAGTCYEVAFWKDGPLVADVFSLVDAKLTCNESQYDINLNDWRTPSGTKFRWNIIIVQPGSSYTRITQPSVDGSRTVMGKGKSCDPKKLGGC